MRKFEIGFVFVLMYVLFAVLQPVFAQEDSGLSVEIQLEPIATFTFSEIYRLKEDLDEVYKLSTMTILNDTHEKKELKIRIQVFVESSSSGKQLIVDSVTNYNNFEISVDAKDEYSIDNTNIKESMLEGTFDIIPIDSAEEKLRDIFGDTVVIDSAGMIPAAKYTYKVMVYDKDDTGLNKILAETSETIDMPFVTGDIEIIFPENGSEIQTESIEFQWEPLQIRDNVNVIYSFKLWELEPGKDLEETISTQPIIPEQNNIENTFISITDQFSFTPGKKYVWQVFAKDEAGYNIGNRSASLPYKFTYLGSGQSFKAITFEYEETPSLINFEFDAPMNENMYLIIKKNGTEHSFELDESSLSKSIDKKEFIGKLDVWIQNSYGDKLSNKKEVIVKADSIDLIYPEDGAKVSLLDNSLNLLWQKIDSSFSEYVVEITNKPSFRNAKQYSVDNSNLILEDRILLSGNKIYWRVYTLNQNNEIFAQSEIGEFQVKQKDIQLLLPDDNADLSGETKFWFERPERAKKIELKIKDGTKTKCKKTSSSNDSFILLQLNSCNLVAGEVYTWQIITSGKTTRKSEEYTFQFVDFTENDSNDLSFLVNPKENEIVSDDTVIFIWDNNDNNKEMYSLTLRDSSNNKIEKIETSGSSYVYNNFPYEGDINWEIKKNEEFVVPSRVFKKVSNTKNLANKDLIDLNELEKIIKNNLDKNSILKRRYWKLDSIEFIDDSNEEDLNVILKEEKDLRAIEK